MNTTNNLKLTGRTRIGTTGKMEHEYIDENTLGMSSKHWASDAVVNMDMEAAIASEAAKSTAEAAAAKTAEQIEAEKDARIDSAIAEMKALVLSGSATIESLKAALGEFRKPSDASYISEVIYEVKAGKLDRAINALQMC